MPIGTSIALGSLIAGAAGAGSAAAGVYGAHKQAETTEEALADARAQRAWQQQQYQDYLTRLQPYRDMGTQAGTQLSARLARGPYIPTAQQLQLPASSIGTLAAKPGDLNG